MNKKVVISIKNLIKSFGELRAVDDLSMDVYSGDIFAFLGSNGSGKTTTIRCLLDICRPDSGKLLIQGKPYSFALSKTIGYLPEERGMYTRAKVKELFMYFTDLRNVPIQKAKVLIHDFLTKVDLIQHKDKKISQLSSGMQQKIQIGLAIIHKPKILILDEPFKGLDPVNRHIFTEIFKELRDDGTTIMYSTHDMDEAQKLADRLCIIKNGKRKAYGTPKEVRRSFGKDNIKIEFSGKFPKNNKLYNARVVNKTAEVIPKKGIKSGEILKYLIKNNLDIIKYELDYPSLNEVFIKICGTEMHGLRPVDRYHQ